MVYEESIMTKLSRSENNLYGEIVDINEDILDLLDILIQAEWDSNTLKQKIAVKMKEKEKVDIEIFEVENKK